MRLPLTSGQRLAGLLPAFCLALCATWAVTGPVQAQTTLTAEPMVQRIARFNQLLTYRQPQGQDPVLIALLWAGAPKGQERTIAYRAGTGVDSEKATVTITEEALADPSLSGSRLTFSFVRLKGQWALTNVVEAWRCRHGAATNSYISAVCP